jgi:hypothetical protein
MPRIFIFTTQTHRAQRLLIMKTTPKNLCFLCVYVVKKITMVKIITKSLQLQIPTQSHIYQTKYKDLGRYVWYNSDEFRAR